MPSCRNKEKIIIVPGGNKSNCEPNCQKLIIVMPQITAYCWTLCELINNHNVTIIRDSRVDPPLGRYGSFNHFELPW